MKPDPQPSATPKPQFGSKRVAQLASMIAFKKSRPWYLMVLLLFVLAPRVLSSSLTYQLSNIFVFSILALGLNVVVGYTGLLHLGIAAFFAIGSYITGILCVPSYPFQFGFAGALFASIIGTGLLGIVLAAPTLRLRGDYLAIVTLGFGEVVKAALRNLEEITGGTKSISGLPPLEPPAWLADVAGRVGVLMTSDLYFYLVSLAILALVVAGLHNLEQSRLGRAWVAVREDELAAACMGINVAAVRLSAFAISAALAGLAGCLYATRLSTTGDPNIADFNRSIIVLCCLILGGLGSLRGALLGVFLLVGYENVAAPFLDEQLQAWGLRGSLGGLLEFSRWNLMIFGLALILMMRFRPEGLLPSLCVKHEMHEER